MLDGVELEQHLLVLLYPPLQDLYEKLQTSAAQRGVHCSEQCLVLDQPLLHLGEGEGELPLVADQDRGRLPLAGVGEGLLAGQCQLL